MPYHEESHKKEQRKVQRLKRPQRYSAIVGDKTFVRNSPYVYTHVVVGRKGDGPIEVQKWCYSMDHAKKEADFFTSVGYCDVQIVEVTVSAYIKEIFPDKK